MMNLHISNAKKPVAVATVDDAIAAFAKVAAVKEFSARTYTPSPLIEGGKVIGYISMNGRFWTRQDDPAHFDLMLSRFWSKHLVAA